MNNTVYMYGNDISFNKNKESSNRTTIRLYNNLLKTICDYNIGDLTESTVDKMMEAYSIVKYDKSGEERAFENFISGEGGNIVLRPPAKTLNKILSNMY